MAAEAWVVAAGVVKCRSAEGMAMFVLPSLLAQNMSLPMKEPS